MKCIAYIFFLSAWSSAAQIEWSESGIDRRSFIAGEVAYRLSGVTDGGVHFKDFMLFKGKFTGEWLLIAKSENLYGLESKIHSGDSVSFEGISFNDYNAVIKFIKLEAAKKEINYFSVSVNAGFIKEFKDAYIYILSKTHCDIKPRSKKFGFCVAPEIEKELHKRKLIEGVCTAMGGSTQGCRWNAEYPIFFRMNNEGISVHDKDNVDWSTSYFFISID